MYDEGKGYSIFRVQGVEKMSQKKLSNFTRNFLVILFYNVILGVLLSLIDVIPDDIALLFMVPYLFAMYLLPILMPVILVRKTQRKYPISTPQIICLSVVSFLLSFIAYFIPSIPSLKLHGLSDFIAGFVLFQRHTQIILPAALFAVSVLLSASVLAAMRKKLRPAGNQ